MPSQVIDRFVARHGEHYDQAYAPMGADHRAARDLTILDPADLDHRLGQYLDDEDPFVVKQHHSLAMFANRINQYGAADRTSCSAEDDPYYASIVRKQRRREAEILAILPSDTPQPMSDVDCERIFGPRTSPRRDAAIAG